TAASTTTAAVTTTEPAATTTAAPGTTTAPPASTAAPTTTTASTTSTTAPPPDPDLPTMLATLAADPDYSTFVDLFVRAGITDDSNFLGPYTLFAPNNEAMATLAPE